MSHERKYKNEKEVPSSAEYNSAEFERTCGFEPDPVPLFVPIPDSDMVVLTKNISSSPTNTQVHLILTIIFIGNLESTHMKIESEVILESIQYLYLSGPK